MRRATTEFVLFLDGDAVLHRNFARATFDAMATDRQIFAVWGTGVRFTLTIPSKFVYLIWTVFTHPAISFASVGAGAVGCSAIMAARTFGAMTIVAIDNVPWHLEMPKKLSATHAINFTLPRFR